MSYGWGYCSDYNSSVGHHLYDSPYDHPPLIEDDSGPLWGDDPNDFLPRPDSNPRRPGDGCSGPNYGGQSQRPIARAAYNNDVENGSNVDAWPFLQDFHQHGGGGGSGGASLYEEFGISGLDRYPRGHQFEGWSRHPGFD
ncbi:hypothetical protein LTR53_005965 [Teratosphaeriaceae sp. CCFEE 6253]|nr:hypothetical protein LTR53_005965 [Teratosphaeriaceae sp. CCFEE 6253]